MFFAARERRSACWIRGMEEMAVRFQSSSSSSPSAAVGSESESEEGEGEGGGEKPS